MKRQGLHDGKSHYRPLGDGRIFSYDTCIFQCLEDGTTIGNVTRYSTTTTRHQNKAGCRLADVLVDGVLEGTQYLR